MSERLVHAPGSRTLDSSEKSREARISNACGGHRLMFAKIANNMAAGEELARFFEAGTGITSAFGASCAA
jgi:hypothetical protein